MGQQQAALESSLTGRGAPSLGADAPEGSSPSCPRKKPAQQLFILVHGICGNERDWEVWRERLASHRRSDWTVKVSSRITPFAYFGGSELCKLGGLLADEVIEWATHALNEHPEIELHFLCHSLGGLVARAALPKICDALDALDEHSVVRYGQFVTLNTPHLGVRGANLWMCWKNMSVLIPTAKFSQIHQLTLQDREDACAGDGPVRSETSSDISLASNQTSQRRTRLFLEGLADPLGRYSQTLARFAQRTAVAASHWDVIVPFCTAAICSTNPFPSPNIFAGEWQTFWRVDAAVGFKEGTPLAEIHAKGGQAAADFEKSLANSAATTAETSGIEATSSDEALSSGSEAESRSAARRKLTERVSWLHSSDKEVEFTAAMLDGMLQGASWRRVAYTLHHPWVNADVHLFTIGKEKKVRDWSIEFIDLLVTMFTDPEGQPTACFDRGGPES